MRKLFDRILVVCEDPSLLDHLGKSLCEQDYDVRCASTAQEALSHYPSWPAPLVIADYNLKDMQGLELTEAICTHNPRARFILLTPAGETPEFMPANRNRILAYLSKPFHVEELMHYVRGTFSPSESQRNRREHNRHPFTVESHCILINPFDDSESRPQAALMRDVSRSGVAMLVRQVLPVPSMIKLAFHLPQHQKPIYILAKSVSCTLTQITGVYRLGAKFIGLLPQELENALIQQGFSNGNFQKEDIFMGKSFKDAVHEWLSNHQSDFAPDGTGGSLTIEAMAAEVCKGPYDHDPRSTKKNVDARSKSQPLVSVKELEAKE